jgi:hypothetical protein
MVLIEAFKINKIYKDLILNKIFVYSFRELSLHYKQLKWDIDWIYIKKLCSC